MNLNLKSPFVVVGMGISGKASVALLHAIGIPPEQIKTFDNNGGADFSTPDEVLAFGPKTLVVSPGVPLALPWIQNLAKQGVVLTNEINLSLPYLENEKWLGVTGSVGKSTTVALLESGLKVIDPHGFVGGNYGQPLAKYVSEVLTKLRPRCKYGILELSSYQLENFLGPQFIATAITYFTPNHMERYSSLEQYYQTKWNLISHSDTPTVLNPNSQELTKWAQQKNANTKLASTELIRIFNLSDCALLGSHNLDNLIVATELALLAGWPVEAIEAMKKYKGLPHRMENLGIKNGVLYINDSKATTIESVSTAVHGILGQFPQTPHLFLLLGGKDKNLPWEDLQSLSGLNSISPVFFGACGELAQSKSKLPGPRYLKMLDALAYCRLQAQNMDIVLLSPGGTSLDEFKNFEDRGRVFAEFFNSI